MAVLTDPERARVVEKLMDRAECPGTVLKADFRAAVNAIDVFMDNNAATINAALPLPYRTAANTAQKAALLAAVVLKRWGRDI